MAFLPFGPRRKSAWIAWTSWAALVCGATLYGGGSTVRAQDSATVDESADQSAADPPEDAAADQSTSSSESSVSPAAERAKQAFDVLQQQWGTIVGNLKEIQQKRRDAKPAERPALDQQVAELRSDADALVDKIVNAGVEVYRADAKAFPQVNQITLSVAQFFLMGDANGDGGDQYEKALGPIKAILEAGGGIEWPYLFTWGGVAAYCSNEFELAADYFAQAKAAGQLGAAPPSRNPRDPNTRIWQQAQQYLDSLPVITKAWEKETQIRAAEAQADDLPRVKLTTTRGDVVIELFENEAPQAVANFLTLVKQGFYDGVVFHRVLPGFMAQGGDPTGTGSGGPGYSIRCECFQPNQRRHFRGSLSMAHAGRNTGGSQFFLTFVPTSSLDGKHTVFGRVIEGMDVAASIKRRDPDANPPVTPDKIIKAEVLRDRGHAYEFARLPER